MVTSQMKQQKKQEQDVFLNSNNDKLKGGTIKFKLTDDTSELIDKITTTLSEQWNMRLYRAFSVKLMLKYLYIQKIEKDLLQVSLVECELILAKYSKKIYTIIVGQPSRMRDNN